MKCHCREACCRQSPTSCTLKPIATPKTPHYHTQTTHYECFLILITSDKKRAKATSHLRRIHRRSALQGTAKAQGYALCLSPEAHWAKKEHLRQCLAHVTRLPRQGCRHRSPTCPWKSMRTRQNRHSQRCTQAHKKPPHARQRKPMRKAAK